MFTYLLLLTPILILIIVVLIHNKRDRAGKETSMSSTWGIGLTLYGKRDLDKSDDSYIATKWIICFFIPLIPLTSYRVRRKETTFGPTGGAPMKLGTTTQYEMVRTELNLKQILNVYIATILIVSAAAIIMNYLSD